MKSSNHAAQKLFLKTLPSRTAEPLLSVLHLGLHVPGDVVDGLGEEAVGLGVLHAPVPLVEDPAVAAALFGLQQEYSVRVPESN